ncbi:hypothetical protein T484DRAFT_1793437 [Baffinella frigidus]|nr:hypothetical protein T484DRAFT_1793437 [Cryptophyta sp. CCMP2293]
MAKRKPRRPAPPSCKMRQLNDALLLEERVVILHGEKEAAEARAAQLQDEIETREVLENEAIADAMDRDAKEASAYERNVNAQLKHQEASAYERNVNAQLKHQASAYERNVKAQLKHQKN